ncbi:hypothetical protein JXA63_02290 [Candidatus Woesebacteria bacterium]|nr:hypothetical protein [Candidatus Woesebacteria bacterium]
MFAQRVVGRINDISSGSVQVQPETRTCGEQFLTIPGATLNGTLVVQHSSGIASIWGCNGAAPYYHTDATGNQNQTFTLTPPAGYECSNITWDIGYYECENCPPFQQGSGCTATINTLLGGDWNNHLWWHLRRPSPPPPPTNVTCSVSGDTATLNWTASTGDVAWYSLRVIENGQGTTCDGSWYLCEPEYNANNLTSSPFSFDITSGNSYRGWMEAVSNDGLWSEAVEFTCVDILPNCKNLSGPTSLVLGETGIYTVDFECPGCVPGELGGHLEYDNSNLIRADAYTGTTGSMTAEWTPQSLGTFRLWCRAWNDAIAECRPPDLVDEPPRYDCTGPDYELYVNVLVPTPTPTPLPCQPGGNCCICIIDNPPDQDPVCRELADYCDEGYEAYCGETTDEEQCESYSWCRCLSEGMGGQRCGGRDEQCCPGYFCGPNLYCMEGICRIRTSKITEYFCDEDGDPISEPLDEDGNPRPLYTAIGCIPVNDKQAFTAFMLTWAIGIGGGLTVLLIAYSGFLFLSSQGDPQRLRLAKTMLATAITGIVMLVFSVTLLRIIGVDILGID